MKRIVSAALAAAGLAAAVGAAAGCSGEQAGAADGPRFSRPAVIDNPYLPLSAHRRCVLSGEVDGVVERSVRTRLERTEPFRIGDRTVRALVIEDRAFEAGALVERTLDYYAQSDDGTVHYLGEDVDDIEDGRVVGHSGSWRVGRDTRTLGVAMPADPRVGDHWRFEDVPGITVEDDEVTGRFERVQVAGDAVHPDVIRVREDLSPEGVSEQKLYARGVGEIRSVPWDLGGMVELEGCTGGAGP